MLQLLDKTKLCWVLHSVIEMDIERTGGNYSFYWKHYQCQLLRLL